MHYINIKNKYIAFNKMNQIQDTVETSNLNFNSETSIKTPKCPTMKS